MVLLLPFHEKLQRVPERERKRDELFCARGWVVLRPRVFGGSLSDGYTHRARGRREGAHVCSVTSRLVVVVVYLPIVCWVSGPALLVTFLFLLLLLCVEYRVVTSVVRSGE